MLTLSLFNFKDNEVIYLSTKQAKNRLAKTFRLSFTLKRSIANGYCYFYFILPAFH